jgi:inosine-uridine nucleoside N-ribohydrolase
LAKELVFNGALIQQHKVNAPELGFSYDFNIRFDPEAAQIALTAPWRRITSVGDVALDTMMTPEIMQRMTAAPTSAMTTYLRRFMLSLPLWDELTAAVAVDPTLVTQYKAVLMSINTAPTPTMA